MKTNINRLIIVVMLSSVVLLNSGCKLIENIFNRAQSTNIIIDTTLLVMKAPDASDQEFKDKFNEIITYTSKPVHTGYYCPCDTSIKMLHGPGVPEIMEQVASGGSSTRRTGVHGNNGGKYGALIWSTNIIFNIIDSVTQESQKDSTKNTGYTPSGFSTVVAVLDTGLDTLTDNSHKLTLSLYKNNDVISCLGNIPGANNGWNFVGNNPFWSDDHSERHGTAVAKFIVNQVYEAPGLGNVKILPEKVFDNSGKGNLSNILCAFAYAKQRGAKIINASFGYYAQKFTKGGVPDSSSYFLKNYIEQTLTASNILLVCAAGNDDRTISWDNSRNLDDFDFFPASLANSLQNVIAVTTVNKHETALLQNHSNHVVDIGVLADNETDFSFVNPFSALGFTKIGSSFATPIVTGKICAHYNSLPIMSGAYSKPALWNTLMSPGIRIVFKNDDLSSQIINGLYTVK